MISIPQFSNSPMNSEFLYRILEGQSKERQREFLAALLRATNEGERDKDVERKRHQRSEAARIVIPEIRNIKRRERCLADPERFMRTYFADRYGKPFERDHLTMIDVIHSRAIHGGRQAIAAPRGRGKTEIVKGMLVYLVLAEIVRFPLAVGATGDLAGKIYRDFQGKFATNDLLYEDFPEVCHPVRALEGAPQRASKQHVDGKLTHIVWTAKGHLSFPFVDGSPYGGVKMDYFGLDAAFRGINIDGDRPDFVLIDDPETEESARSLQQIETREKIIDQDIAGLAGQNRDLAIVVLTTIQNRYCLSYQLTGREIKPAWNGVRFGLIEQWPTRMDLWETYIAKRHAAQTAGDPHGVEAVDFYLTNREAMDEGAVMLSASFNEKQLEDGKRLVYSSLQECFNKIADTSMAAFRTEYQNDPEPEEEITTLGLTAAKVQSRTNNFKQRTIPPETERITVGLDLGKFASHWVKIAWLPGAAGCVVDYGVMETHGLSAGSDSKATEVALLASLESFADDIMNDGSPEFVLIDSGTFTHAAYEFTRRAGHPFYPSKGWASGRFRPGERTKTRIPFDEAYAHFQAEERVWLYNINTEHWKTWLQERFLIRTFDEAGNLNAGALSLFDTMGDTRRHLSFAHHIVSEERRMVPVFGKELKPEWFVVNRNNHWLDATALACAAAGILGVRVVEPLQPQPQPKPATASQQTTSPFIRDGRSFLSKRAY